MIHRIRAAWRAFKNPPHNTDVAALVRAVRQFQRERGQTPTV